MKMKTSPVLRTTFKIITNRQNVRETLYETVSQVSSEKKKKKKTKLATTCCILRPFTWSFGVKQ